MTWAPINLANVPEVEPPRPQWAGLVYPGARHLWSGEPESAKSLTSDIVLLEAIRNGGGAILVDLEMGASSRRARLVDLGATLEELGRIVYVEPASPPDDEDIALLIAETGAEPADTVAVIDAAATAYAISGLDDHARKDVEAFAVRWIAPLYSAGVASILIDHVAKAREGRGRFAFGSERKVGAVDVHLGFEALMPLRRGGTGLVRIATHKDRVGHLPRPYAGELELTSQPDTHRIGWAWRAPDAVTRDDHWRPTALMARISAHLAGKDGPVSRSQVERDVPGKAQFKRQAMDELVAYGYAHEAAGARGSRMLTHVKTFLENDPVPPRPDLVPDGDAVPRPTPSGPFKGDGVGDGVEDAVASHPGRGDRDGVEALFGGVA